MKLRAQRLARALGLDYMALVDPGPCARPWHVRRRVST